MNSLFLTYVVLRVCASATLWLNAYELGDKSCVIPEEGQYHVWTWMDAGTEASIEIGGQTRPLKIAPVRDEKSDSKDSAGKWNWRRGESVQLSAGPCEIGVTPGLYVLALSTSNDFDPRAALPHIRVTDVPHRVEDDRIVVKRHTDTVFSMPHFASKREWEHYGEELRRHILISSGLWPMPPELPLNAKVYDRITHDDYTVEKVHFEAFPGFLVSGNLYRPVGFGPFPAILNPHGHAPETGRLTDIPGLYSVPACCITFARMGIVALSYDMLGVLDSKQIEHGFASSRELLWGISPFGLQLLSNIRALDFLETLDYVDADRIGCTGASGGGTQTFSLTAVDSRVKAAAPVCMVSATMQGGCRCENAPLLRLHSSNMEITALMAPRPLLLVSASGDWTAETPRREYPAIRSIYALYGATDRVGNAHFEAEHNYNRQSRESVYPFFSRHLLGKEITGFSEPDFAPDPPETLRIFPGDAKPSEYPDQETLFARMRDARRSQWKKIMPASKQDLPAFEAYYGKGLGHVLDAAPPDLNDLACTRQGILKHADYVLERWVLHRTGAGDAVPALLYRSGGPGPQDAVVLVHGEGKAAFADIEAGAPGPLVSGLLARGKAVLCIDTFLQGEHHDPQARKSRVYAGKYPETFAPTDTALRVQDVVTALAFLKARRDMTGEMALAGLGGAGMWCLFASAIDMEVERTYVDLNHFDVDDDAAWCEKYFVPCLRAVGDVQTAAALIAPRELFLAHVSPGLFAPWPGLRVLDSDQGNKQIVELLGR